MALFESLAEPDPIEPPISKLEAELEALGVPEESATDPLPPAAADSAQPIIVFDDVSISFDGRSVLENVSFSEIGALGVPEESATDPLPPAAADSAQPIIVFDDVSISFDGRSVLENVSFS